MTPQLFAATPGDSRQRHVLTIGNFDGVHRGHQHLLSRVVARAREYGIASAAITFSPLPIEVLRPDIASRRLTTTADRITLIRALGFDAVVVVEFTPSVAAIPAEDFVEQMVQALHPAEVLVGDDFAFGHGRAGTPALLAEMGKRHGFRVEVLNRITNGDQEISSTRIRQRLESGDIGGAAALFGRPYFLRGTVVVGNQRGRLLGFPTANLRLTENLLAPADGIFAAMTLTEAGDALIPSMVYVGSRPTFVDSGRAVEVHLLDFDGDLYGQELAVVFAERIRGDRRFDGVDALIEQMRQDSRVSRELLSHLPPGWPGAPLTMALGIAEGATRRVERA